MEKIHTTKKICFWKWDMKPPLFHQTGQSEASLWSFDRQLVTVRILKIRLDDAQRNSLWTWLSYLKTGTFTACGLHQGHYKTHYKQHLNRVEMIQRNFWKNLKQPVKYIHIHNSQWCAYRGGLDIVMWLWANHVFKLRESRKVSNRELKGWRFL